MNPTCYLPDALIPKFDFFPNKKGNSKNSNNTLSWTLHKEVFFSFAANRLSFFHFFFYLSSYFCKESRSCTSEGIDISGLLNYRFQAFLWKSVFVVMTQSESLHLHLWRNKMWRFLYVNLYQVGSSVPQGRVRYAVNHKTVTKKGFL